MNEDVKFSGGVKKGRARTGKVDPVKTRIAKRTVTTGTMGMGREKTAGMLIDSVNMPAYNSGYRLDAYRNSYANGLNQRSGTYDVPTFFQEMNSKNGGQIQIPVTLQEKYSWYRYFYITDPYIGRAVDLLTDLPMSKLTLNMPKSVPKDVREELSNFFEYQLERIDAFKLLQNILREIHIIGNCFIFASWDEKMKMWDKAVILPPEETYVFYDPFSMTGKIQYRPEKIISMIQQQTGGYNSLPGGGSIGQGSTLPGSGMCDQSLSDDEVISNIPEEIIEMVRERGCIVMDTDPMTGSFVAHLDRRRIPYHDLAASQLERIMVPMIQKEYLKFTQLSLLNRNMTPKNVISADGLMPDEVDSLREQIDLSYLSPDYSIVTNYPVTWEQIGAQDRLIDLSREYEQIDNQIFAALGVTRELLTGETTFSGGRITVEILNTMFMMSRIVLTDYIENDLFKPICEAKGWYTQDKNGIKKYWYPRLGFNRLSIRDNAEVFDSLYQLYVKGSLPIDVIYELFNLDADRMNEKLKADLFTVRDSTFNRTVEEMATEGGRQLVDKTDYVDRLAEYFGFKGKNSDDNSSDNDGLESEEIDELDKKADELVNELPEGVSEEELRQYIKDDVETDKIVNEIAQILPVDADDETIKKVVKTQVELDTQAEAIAETLPVDATVDMIKEKVNNNLISASNDNTVRKSRRTK